MNIWPFSTINGLRFKLDATLLKVAELKHSSQKELTRLKEQERWQKNIAEGDAELFRQEIRVLEQRLSEIRSAAGGMCVIGGVSEMKTTDQFYGDVGRAVVGSGGLTVFHNYDATCPGVVAYRLDVQKPSARRHENTIERALEIAAEGKSRVVTRPDVVK